MRDRLFAAAVTIVVVLTTTIVLTIILGNLLRYLGVGPYWAQRTTSSGIEYACMFESKEEYILATLDENGDRNHVEESHRD